MHLGPDHLIVAARVALADRMDADSVEDLANHLDRCLSEILTQGSARLHRSDPARLVPASQSREITPGELTHGQTSSPDPGTVLPCWLASPRGGPQKPQTWQWWRVFVESLGIHSTD